MTTATITNAHDATETVYDALHYRHDQRQEPFRHDGIDYMVVDDGLYTYVVDLADAHRWATESDIEALWSRYDEYSEPPTPWDDFAHSVDFIGDPEVLLAGMEALGYERLDGVGGSITNPIYAPDSDDAFDVLDDVATYGGTLEDAATELGRPLTRQERADFAELQAS